MADLPPPKKESSILSSQEQTLRLARSRGIDGMLTRNSDSTFEQRATFRHLADQAARQRNLEAIMVMASRHCEETAAGGEMDSDWLTRFLQLAEDISMVPMPPASAVAALLSVCSKNAARACISSSVRAALPL